MAANANGTATCDRCEIVLPGYGVINGLVCTDLLNGVIRNLIFCYRNNCRTVMLTGMLAHLGKTGCTHCNAAIPTRGVASAMLASDLHPAADGDVERTMQFCYSNNSRTAFLLPLTQGGTI